MRLTKISVAAILAAAALLGAASDASARRHTDARCLRQSGWERCSADTRIRATEGPIALSAPATCHTQNVLAFAKATGARAVRRLTLRLDGVVIGKSTPKRSYYVGVGVDCSSLAVGEHTLTASLLRRDGSRAEASRPLTRLVGPAPDDIF